VTGKKKVIVGLSGGVDSSVAAALLKQQGYDVIGVFMQFWYPSGVDYGENRCCSLESWHEAQAVARVLAIPIHKINFGKQFKKTIVDEFINEYGKGHTPNPCVACNKFIKFDLLLKYAQTVFGADYLATGHYVRIKNYELRIKNKITKIYELQRPKDKNKDQTYFLYNLKQEQLKHLLFPLAGYQKERVRGLAKKLKLQIHDKPDSQEICFVGRSCNDFLNRYLKPRAGKIVTFDSPPARGGDKGGWELGEHRGLIFYTLGQRTGLGLSGGPWYVIDYKCRSNQLIVSKNSNHQKLLNQKIFFKSVNWLAGAPKFPLRCQAQIRYRTKATDCVVKKIDGKLMAEFKQPPHAPASGQSIVFYDGDRLLGGGVID